MISPVAKPVGIGLIGAGYIAGYHVSGLRATGGAELRVIAGRDPTRAAAAAAHYAIAESTADWRAMLARSDIEAVVVTTPDDTHEEIATAAAAAGKHILLQKPMAPTAGQCRRIVAAARAAGVRLQVSFMHRYFEEVVRARELMAEGAIGRVFSIRLRNATPGPDWNGWFYNKARVGGGVVMQLGVHGIDLLRHLFGDIESISAQTALLRTERTLADGTVVHPDNEDHALAIYRFASGAIASHEMDMSEVHGCDRFTMEIYGEHGTIWLRTMRGALAIYAPEHTGAREWVVPELPTPAFGVRQHQAFLDLVRGEAAPDGTDMDGLASVVVAEAIYRASAAGRELDIGAQERTIL
jgi:predicted dehydrogenase